MKEERIMELKLQSVLALLFLIGGNIFSQSGNQFPINDPRNPNCPCHKAQKLADDEFKKLLASANQSKNTLGNLPQQKKENKLNVVNRPEINDGGISEAEQEKINQLLNNDAVSNKNILDEGISDAEQENNNSLRNELEGNQQLVNFQKDFIPQSRLLSGSNPVDQGVSVSDNEINKFIALSNDLDLSDQGILSQQKFSSGASSNSSQGSSVSTNFKHKRSGGHIKFKHRKKNGRYAKLKSRLDYHNWDFLKEARKVASCYHWS